MNREEFRIQFSQAVAEDDFVLYDEHGEDPDIIQQLIDRLTNIAEVAAEPLFEEIKSLKADINQRDLMIRKQGDIIESHVLLVEQQTEEMEILRDLCQRTALEIEKLEESEEQKIAIIKDLEDKLLKAENDRAYWFDMFGLEKSNTIKMMTEIERLKEDLTYWKDEARRRENNHKANREMAQNEIEGLQTILSEKDTEIQKLKDLINAMHEEEENLRMEESEWDE